MSHSAKDRLSQLEERYSLHLSSKLRTDLERFTELLRHWGARINLAGPALLADPYPHLLEAVWAVQSGFVQADQFADVGSGSGIPGLILALAKRDASVVLIERNTKKAVFLKEAARVLQASARVFEGSFEAFQAWSDCDLVTLRAVSPSPALLKLLSENGLPLLWFRAGPKRAELEGFRLAGEKRVPGSRQRRVALFRVARGERQGD